MAWVKRGRRRYYYRSRRVDGRRVTLYIGKGPAAERFLARERERKAERQRAAALDRELDDLQRRLRALSRVVLEAEGYYLHHGEWRRKREHPRSE